MRTPVESDTSRYRKPNLHTRHHVDHIPPTLRYLYLNDPCPIGARLSYQPDHLGIQDNPRAKVIQALLTPEHAPHGTERCPFLADSTL
jgi:hypothetical protein